MSKILIYSFVGNLFLAGMCQEHYGQLFYKEPLFVMGFVLISILSVVLGQVK